MNVSCPECRSVFRVDPAKVPPTGVQARCNVCGAIMLVELHPPVSEIAAGAREPEQDLVAHGLAPAAVAAPSQDAPEPAVEPGPESEPATRPDAVAPVEPVRLREPELPPAGTTLAAAPPPAIVAEPRPRPINPYLNNTPELRARRLARALVSDLVAYNPQKREQGLRDGTLRQLFRDEIRKSWDEYVEQVGASVAESTPHFQDALNDVLAGGRRIF